MNTPEPTPTEPTMLVDVPYFCVTPPDTSIDFYPCHGESTTSVEVMSSLPILPYTGVKTDAAVVGSCFILLGAILLLLRRSYQ